MGENTKTENDNIAVLIRDAQTVNNPEGTVVKLADVLKNCGLTAPPNFTDHVIDIALALDRFACNRALWFSDDPDSDALLQKHLCFTLMVPGGRANLSKVAVQMLAAVDRFPWRKDPDNVKAVEAVCRPNVRFPGQKSWRVMAAMDRWSEIKAEVSQLIVDQDCNDSPAAFIRTQLMARGSVGIEGFGPKAAAHFMRNTGLMRGYGVIPIIDTHVKKLLLYLGYVYEDENPTYADYVEKFMRLARKEAIPPLLLDAVAWCGFANNWNVTASDFDNFNYKHKTKTS
jgi:thermostable 8-oxoguanine DNA glycosylase